MTPRTIPLVCTIYLFHSKYLFALQYLFPHASEVGTMDHWIDKNVSGSIELSLNDNHDLAG